MGVKITSSYVQASKIPVKLGKNNSEPIGSVSLN